MLAILRPDKETLYWRVQSSLKFNVNFHCGSQAELLKTKSKSIIEMIIRIVMMVARSH